MELDTADKILEWARKCNPRLIRAESLSQQMARTAADKATAEFLAECVRLRAEFDRVTGPGMDPTRIDKWPFSSMQKAMQKTEAKER